MKTKLLCCLIAAGIKSIACFAATPEFDKAFTEALLRVSQESGNDEPGRPLVIPQVMDDLRKHGTNTEIGAKITKVLRGPVNQDWDAALQMSGLLGPSFDRTAITSAVRDSLPRVIVIGTRQLTILGAVGYLCAYGTPEDIALLKRYAVEVRTKDKILADSFDATLILGEGNRRLIERQQAASEGRGTPPSSQRDSNPPLGSLHNIDSPKHHSVEPPPVKRTDQTNSTPWTIIIVIIVAVLGLFWLRGKRRAK